MIKVAYSDKVVAESGCSSSPSAEKPKQVATAIRGLPWVEFIDPTPVSKDDFYLCHDQQYVDDIMALKQPNGFGTYSQSVVDSLPYTSGAMHTAAMAATKDMPAAALVSGFHHAGYSGFKDLGLFCTFNGLMVTACKMLESGVHKVAIVDMDMHWGNGTEDIILALKHRYGVAPRKGHRLKHITFGQMFHNPGDAKKYMAYLEIMHDTIAHFKPSVILFQAGADVHVDDPYGGVLDNDQIKERDRKTFQMAKQLGIPLAWNLAGGYQRDKDGGISKVLAIHLNTFQVAKEVYGPKDA